MDSEVTYLSEAMNPKGQAMRDIRMAARRSLALEKLLELHMDMCDGDVDRMKYWTPDSAHPPMKRAIKAVWDNSFKATPFYRYHDLWVWLVDYWRSGAILRNRRLAIENLPLSLKQEFLP